VILVWSNLAFLGHPSRNGQILYVRLITPIMPNVEQVLSQTDPGDDMQRRLRYQASYGASLCLDLLIDDQDTSEVFCEHHEDFLIKRKDGKYVGVQVKTRLPGAGPFKTGDEPVKNALNRFVELDLLFPGQFYRFVLVANCDFYDGSKVETNMAFVLELIRTKSDPLFTGTMKDLIKDLRVAHKCKKQAVLDALKKVHLHGQVPKFEDMTASLIMKAAQLRPQIIEYWSLEACVKALIDKVLEASAVSCNEPISSHFVFATSPTGALVQSVIAHKRMTPNEVKAVITQTTAVLLMPTSNGNVMPTGIPTGSHIVEKKMAAGRISAPSISAAKDQQTSAEYQLQEWIARYGTDVASQRRNQIDLLVNTRCAEAFDKNRLDDVPFGTAMLSDVRDAMKLLAEQNDQTFGLKYEQLLGFVSLSTQACRTWWSDPFSLEDPDATV